MTELLTITRAERDDTVVLALDGELDVSTAGKLVADAAGVPAGGRLVLDLSALSFMDSAGVRALMNLDVRSRAEGWTLVLAGAQPPVVRLLAICHFDQRVEMRDAAP
jgi:anti-sigma B factor antagonist